MNHEDDLEDTWHTGLHAQLDTSFPKKCTNCGRVFQNAEAFFTETIDINEQDKGLKTYVDDDTSTVVEAFRNCVCGSTLMEMFDDRRDEIKEEAARKKREEELVKSMKVEIPVATKNSASTFSGDTTIVMEQSMSKSEGASNEGQWNDAWYEGLRPSGEAAFPKKCLNCGRVFETQNDFFTETASIGPQKTGLKESVDDDSGVLVEAFRNCPCGSTLMDFFSDRRDMSSAGKVRRAKFDEMHNFLIGSGMDADIAYAELLKVIRGGKSQILANIKPPNSK